MKKNQKKNSSELYAVIGLGRFGMALARELAAKGKSLLVIDYDREKINEVLEFTDNAFVINSLTIDALEETGIGEADVAVVCIGEKIDISILATLNLMKLGVKRVISKAMSEEQGEVLKLLGAEVVYPEHDMALRLASKLVSPRVHQFKQLDRHNGDTHDPDNRRSYRYRLGTAREVRAERDSTAPRGRNDDRYTPDD